jgi:hypothetical protein
MESSDPVECPFCMERMQLEMREETTWLICPNGCATEIEVVVRKPADAEPGPSRIRAAQS